jgi:hypothetical protein
VVVRGVATSDRVRGAVLGGLLERDPESLAAAEIESLAAIYDDVSEELYRRMVEVFSGPGDWHMRLARAVEATLDQIQSDPGIARLCFGEPARRHACIGARRAASRERVVRFLAAEYEDEQGRRLPEVRFEFLFGAILRTAQDEVTAGREPAVVAARIRELLALLEPVPA